MFWTFALGLLIFGVLCAGPLLLGGVLLCVAWPGPKGRLIPPGAWQRLLHSVPAWSGRRIVRRSD
jgi:hypothetical protein